MPSVITTIRPTTELEAVNEMLAAIGEAPLADATDLSTSTLGDVVMAIDILRGATRDCLTEGWQFNYETGVEVAPTSTITWVDTDGESTELNVFKKPVDVLAWDQTPCSENKQLDLIERVSKQYQEAAAVVPVLYDRAKNRDGAEETEHPYVYIDAVYAFDFAHLPQTARSFITIAAARRFVQKVLGSETLRSFTADDERMAYRALKRDQGLKEHLNMLNTAEAFDIHGRRPRYSGRASRRVCPGRA